MGWEREWWEERGRGRGKGGVGMGGFQSEGSRGAGETGRSPRGLPYRFLADATSDPVSGGESFRRTDGLERGA